MINHIFFPCDIRNKKNNSNKIDHDHPPKKASVD